MSPHTEQITELFSFSMILEELEADSFWAFCCITNLDEDNTKLGDLVLLFAVELELEIEGDDGMEEEELEDKMLWLLLLLSRSMSSKSSISWLPLMKRLLLELLLFAGDANAFAFLLASFSIALELALLQFECDDLASFCVSGVEEDDDTSFES